jgi:hypothetical protein
LTSVAGEFLLEPARRAALSHVVPGLGGNTTIRLARHKRAGVLGSALHMDPAGDALFALAAEAALRPLRAEL